MASVGVEGICGMAVGRRIWRSSTDVSHMRYPRAHAVEREGSSM